MEKILEQAADLILLTAQVQKFQKKYPKETNSQGSKTNPTFIEACKKVGLPKHVAVIHTRTSTKQGESFTSLSRQYSKWKMGKGLAYKFGRG